MSKHMLFYEHLAPVSPASHGDLFVEATGDYRFSARVNSVPLVAAEFAHAAAEYSIVFAGENVVMPMAVLGVDDEVNLYVREDGTWDARYVPAFVRRYPFVFSRSEDGETFTLCVDETFNGCNREGRGNRLFDHGAERAPFLDGILGFLQEYQGDFQRTQDYCARLKDLGLLEPMQAEFSLESGSKRTLSGFMAVNRDRLKALDAGQIADLAHSDELELTYAHLLSMKHFTTLAGRAAGAGAEEG